MITDVTVGGVQETSAEGSASKFTCYEVRTRLANGAEFVAWRRFSEFDRLHASLALNVPFACTKSFWGRFDDAVIAKRKAELECYVQTVLLACGGRALPALGSFLQLPVELHAQNDEVPASVFAGGSGELPPVAGEGGHPVAHVGRQGWMPQFGGREGQTPYGSPARGLPEFGGAGAQLGGAGSGAMSGGAFPPRVGSVRSDGASGPVGGMNSLLSLPTSAEEYEQRHEAIHNLATPAAPARQPELETKLDKLDNLVVVSMILPVRISRVDAGKDLDPEDDQGRAEGDYEWEIEFLAESLIGRQQLSHVIDDVGSVHWVGCPAWSSISAAESASLSDALEAVGCTALILPLEQRAPHFAFCRKVLWPLLHNQSLHSAGRLDEPFSDEEWRAYCNVNKKMTDKVLEIAEPDSMVWVHDYHLLLLPSFLIRKLPVANVGLSLHTPFPSSDVFRALSVRDELLRAMLNADLVHFHLFEYARNFLACCKRMLGLEHEFVPGGFLAVRDQKRVVYVQASHVGIEPDSLAPHLRPVDAAGLPPGLEGHAELHAALDSGKALIGGIDECERLRGITLKLLAFEQLLESSEEWRGKVCLLQLLVGARNFLPASAADSAGVRAELRAIASRVNSAYPLSVVLVEVPTVSVAQRMAVWASVRVAVFSAVREGVNAHPLEYVYARSGEGAGVVVLSETCSCAHVLNGALRVNVWSSDELMGAMLRALTMAPAERIARQQRDLIFVLANTTSSWAERFFVDLKAVGRRAHKEDEPAMALGFGLASFRCVGMGGMRTLEVSDVLAAYRKTVRRAIFVDWGGTLVPNDDNPGTPSLASEEYARRPLPAATHHCLEQLCHDPRNFVMVVSGLARAQMEHVFGALPAISLAAEYGLLYRVGSTPGAHYRGAGHWQQVVESFNDDWKDLAAAIVETYAMRTNGSYVQRKGSSVVWRFEDADLEFGAQQAKEMREHLDNLLQGYPVEVQVGKGYVEIKPAGVDKGAIVSHMLNHLAAASGGVDFVLCVGDDSADEKMFETLNARYGLASSSSASSPKRQHGALHAQTHVFCATVGRKPSAAQYYVNDHEEVIELLQSLRLHSTRSNRNRSLTDLSRLGQSGGQQREGAYSGGGGAHRASVSSSSHAMGAALGAARAIAAAGEALPPFAPFPLPVDGVRSSPTLPFVPNCGLYGQRAHVQRAHGHARSNDFLPPVRSNDDFAPLE
mmetsp:Transcript_8817/g.20589  ORF Transcript_8817/g.20589 Transcript_8817/m.20589 type:complete len:1206 (+) Transcript_8817:157-3774(+)